MRSVMLSSGRSAEDKVFSDLLTDPFGFLKGSLVMCGSRGGPVKGALVGLLPNTPMAPFFLPAPFAYMERRCNSLRGSRLAMVMK